MIYSYFALRGEAVCREEAVCGGEAVCGREAVWGSGCVCVGGEALGWLLVALGGYGWLWWLWVDLGLTFEGRVTPWVW